MKFDIWHSETFVPNSIWIKHGCLPHATLALGSCLRWASKTASLTWSHILSERRDKNYSFTWFKCVKKITLRDCHVKDLFHQDMNLIGSTPLILEITLGHGLLICRLVENKKLNFASWTFFLNFSDKFSDKKITRNTEINLEQPNRQDFSNLSWERSSS